MNRKKYDISEKIIFFFLLLNFCLAVFSCVRNVLLHYRDVFPPLFCDHTVLYNECRLTLERINIQNMARSSHACAWPWTRVLGILVHGAFLSPGASRVYSCLLYLVFISLTAFAVCRTVAAGSRRIVTASVALIFLSSWYYVYLVCAFNNGSLVCILIILALAVMDEHPVTAGIIMAFAMVKAQIAFPFFVVFLFRKKWKTIFTSVGIVVGAWALYCVLTASTPVEQLGYLLFGRTDVGYQSYLRFGMFDFILLFDNTKSMTALFLSAAAGLALLVFVELKAVPAELKRDYRYLSYFAPAVCSLLWFYTTKCDYLVLTVVALGLMEWWAGSRRSTGGTLFVLCGFGCTLMNLTNILAQLLAGAGLIDPAMAQPLEGRFDTVLLLIMLAALGVMAHKGRFTPVKKEIPNSGESKISLDYTR